MQVVTITSCTPMLYSLGSALLFAVASVTPVHRVATNLQACCACGGGVREDPVTEMYLGCNNEPLGCTPPLTTAINQNRAASGFEMCFAPSTFGAWGKTGLESCTKQFKPHLIYCTPFVCRL